MKLKSILVFGFSLLLLSACSNNSRFDNDHRDGDPSQLVKKLEKKVLDLENKINEENIGMDKKELFEDDSNTYTSSNNLYSIKYPSDLVLNEEIINNKNTWNLGKAKNVILLSSDYALEEGVDPDKDNYDANWNRINNGFKIAFREMPVDETWYGWDNFGAIETSYFGDIISEEEITIGENKVFKRVREGFICLDDCDNPDLKSYKITFVVIPNKYKNKVIETWMLSRSNNHDSYLNLYEDIIKSFQWNE